MLRVGERTSFGEAATEFVKWQFGLEHHPHRSVLHGLPALIEQPTRAQTRVKHPAGFAIPGDELPQLSDYLITPRGRGCGTVLRTLLVDLPAYLVDHPERQDRLEDPTVRHDVPLVGPAMPVDGEQVVEPRDKRADLGVVGRPQPAQQIVDPIIEHRRNHRRAADLARELPYPFGGAGAVDTTDRGKNLDGGLGAAELTGHRGHDAGTDGGGDRHHAIDIPGGP